MLDPLCQNHLRVQGIDISPSIYQESCHMKMSRCWCAHEGCLALQKDRLQFGRSQVHCDKFSIPLEAHYLFTLIMRCNILQTHTSSIRIWDKLKMMGPCQVLSFSSWSGNTTRLCNTMHETGSYRQLLVGCRPLLVLVTLCDIEQGSVTCIDDDQKCHVFWPATNDRQQTYSVMGLKWAYFKRAAE